MADPDTPYEVGYGKPPKATQFQPGQSGNKRGRPKGAKGLRAELKEELDEKVMITVEGKPQRISKRRLVLKSLASQAIKGNVSAADKLLAFAMQAEGLGDERPQARGLSDTDKLILERMLGPVTDVERPVADPSDSRRAEPDARMQGEGDEGAADQGEGGDG